MSTLDTQEILFNLVSERKNQREREREREREKQEREREREQFIAIKEPIHPLPLSRSSVRLRNTRRHTDSSYSPV